MADLVEITLKMRRDTVDWISANPAHFGRLLSLGMELTKDNVKDDIKDDVSKTTLPTSTPLNILPNTLQPALQPTLQTTVRLGQIGEGSILTILSEKYNVTNTTHDAKMGDLSIYIDNTKIIVEVKNYSNLVPSHNIDKFYRDLRTANASGALFISLRTQIATISENYSVQYVGVGDRVIPVIFIVSDLPAQILASMGHLRSLIAMREESVETLKNSSVIAELAFGVGEMCDSLAKTRDAAQCIASQTTQNIVRHATDLAVVESNLRYITQQLKSEITKRGSWCEVFEKAQYYTRISTENRALLTRIINLIPVNENQSPWVAHGNLIEHENGIYVKILSASVSVGLPLTLMTEIGTHVSLFMNGNAEIVKKHIVLLLSENVYNIVGGIFTKKIIDKKE